MRALEPGGWRWWMSRGNPDTQCRWPAATRRRTPGGRRRAACGCRGGGDGRPPLSRL